MSLVMAASGQAQGPAVASTQPANGAQGVSPRPTVTVQFNEPAFVTNSAFQLECGSNRTSVPLSHSPEVGPAEIYSVTPTQMLPGGAACIFSVVGAQVRSLFGQEGSSFTMTFSTLAAPAVLSTRPQNGALVGTNVQLEIVFSTPVNLTSTALLVTCGLNSESVDPNPRLPGGTTTFTLTPFAHLPAGASCRLLVTASQVTAVSSGLQLSGPPTLVVSFTTDSAPLVVSTTPSNGATAVALSPTIAVTFNKPVRFAVPALRLECPVGTPVNVTLPATTAITYTVTPNVPLPSDTDCTATVLASQVTDALGTPLAANVAFLFATVIRPRVTLTDPLPGERVPSSATVRFTFNQAVNVTPSAFVFGCNNTPQAFTISPAPPGNSAAFTLTPSAPLPAGECIVVALASEITDSRELHPLGDVELGFSVMP
ncbi:MAG TPA: Ig-like domain-containing protein [Thermoanaerobaculia bacterium]|jgi:hypothetical protein|nr:Ig-like domain-containing protein [Thermoanaerobaculia bacterium]